MKETEGSMLWLLDHHVQAVLTLVEINMMHDIIDTDIAGHYLNEKAKNSDTIWEEEVWKKIADLFLIERESATLYDITPK